MDVKDLEQIGRMTRHQIYQILSRKVDKDGKVELHYRDAGGTQGGAVLTDYASILAHTYRLRFEKEGLPAEFIEQAVQRELAKAAASGLVTGD